MKKTYLGYMYSIVNLPENTLCMPQAADEGRSVLLSNSLFRGKKNLGKVFPVWVSSIGPTPSSTCPRQ